MLKASHRFTPPAITDSPKMLQGGPVHTGHESNLLLSSTYSVPWTSSLLFHMLMRECSVSLSLSSCWCTSSEYTALGNAMPNILHSVSAVQEQPDSGKPTSTFPTSTPIWFVPSNIEPILGVDCHLMCQAPTLSLSCSPS